MDSLAMFFGAKKRKSTRRSPKRKVSTHGKVVVRGRERKLYKGKNGGLYYRTKSGKTYVDAKFVRAHKSPRRVRRSPRRSTRRRASPKRRTRRTSPKRRTRRASPKRRRSSPRRRTRYGYGLGQPSLMDMMGPAGLMVYPQ